MYKTNGRCSLCTDSGEMQKLTRFVQCPTQVSDSLTRSASRFGIKRSERSTAYSSVKRPCCAGLHLSNDRVLPVIQTAEGGEMLESAGGLHGSRSANAYGERYSGEFTKRAAWNIRSCAWRGWEARAEQRTPACDFPIDLLDWKHSSRSLAARTMAVRPVPIAV
jgi:hypothetical protein